MRRLFFATLFATVPLWVVAVPALAQSSQPTPPPRPGAQPREATPRTGTARLSGQVTALDTGRPIRRAQIRVASTEREPRTVSTDAEGRWSLRDLAAGRYTISVSKGGFVTLTYGQRRPFESGRTVDVVDGQSIEKLDVALPRGSAVTGRVVDEFGDPVMGANVNAVRYRFLSGVRRLVATVAIDTTDDLGQYRLHGLAPGNYYISANVSPAGPLGSDDRTGYASTYFPGTVNPGEATRLTLAVGQEAADIVITLTPTRLSTVSGTATDSSGRAIANGVVALRSSQPGGRTTSGIIRTGTWSISGVVPGDYVLALQYVGNVEEVAVTGRVSALAEVASQPVSVTGEDVRGIALVASPGGTARGQVRSDERSTSPPALTNLMIVASDTSGGPYNTSSARVGANGTFELAGLNGLRMLRAVGLPTGWHVKSATLNGTDVLDAGIDVKPGQSVTGVEITLTQQAGDLSGAVTDAKGAPVVDYVVVLFPPEPDRWGWQSRYVRTARPDQTGRFSITGLPAGSYLAVALEYLEPGEETNPEFLEKLKRAGTSVVLTEGEKKTLTLKLTPQ